jgi:hypothetical protein
VATALPGMYGVSPQDASLKAHVAGPVETGHDKAGAQLRPQGSDAAGPYTPQLPAAQALRGMRGGQAGDRTPQVHGAPAAPWAQMDAGEAGVVSRIFHGISFAINQAVRGVPASHMPIYLDNVQTPGSSMLEKAPGQLAGGSLDVTQGRGVPNSYGFGGSHILRYFSGGSVPTAYSASSERALIYARGGITPGRGASQNVDSKVGAGGRTRLGPVQEQAVPTPYVPPANPTVLPQTGYGRVSGFTYGG